MVGRYPEFIGTKDCNGGSGREEIVRWESAVAQGRSRVFQATQSVEAARIALNQILAQPQDRRWFTSEETIDPEVFPFLSGRLDDLYDDPRVQSALREGFVEIAFANAPEVAAVDQQIEARQIVFDQRKQRYYLPTFQIEGSYTEQLGEPDSFLFGDDHNYQFTVSAEYPIYEGGRRKAEVRQADQKMDLAE